MYVAKLRNLQKKLPATSQHRCLHQFIAVVVLATSGYNFSVRGPINLQVSLRRFVHALHPICAYTQTGIRSLGSRIVADHFCGHFCPQMSLVSRKCAAVPWLRSTEVIYARHWVVSVQYSGTSEPLKRQSHHSSSSTRIIYATCLSFLSHFTRHGCPNSYLPQPTPPQSSVIYTFLALTK